MDFLNSSVTLRADVASNILDMDSLHDIQVVQELYGSILILNPWFRTIIFSRKTPRPIWKLRGRPQKKQSCRTWCPRTHPGLSLKPRRLFSSKPENHFQELRAPKMLRKSVRQKKDQLSRSYEKVAAICRDKSFQ